MKILILVQGTFAISYREIEKTMRRTWMNSITSPDILVKVYYGAFDPQGNLFPEAEIVVEKEQVTENKNGDIIVGAYDMMGPYFDPRGEKLIRALEYSLKFEYDFVLRVCNTSYIRFDKLLTYLKNCPQKKFYDGARNLFNYKYYFVSGHNSIMSRDCVVNLVENKTEFLECRYPEDLAVGYFLMHKLNYTKFEEEPFIPTHIPATVPGFDANHFLDHRAYNYRFRGNSSKEMQEYHEFLQQKTLSN